MLRRFVPTTHLESFARWEVLVQTSARKGVGSPVAFRCDVKKLAIAALSLFALLFFLFLGTLLAFRQTERNRYLEDRVVELELWSRLSRGRETVVVAPAVVRSESSELVSAIARVDELTAECDGESCDIRATLLSSGTGSTEGRLLFVLETEVSRIGGAEAMGRERKRFLTFPVGEALEAFSEKTAQGLAKRPFRFSRALHTQAEIVTGPQVKPLWIHTYLFSSDGVLTGHSRKPIAEGE